MQLPSENIKRQADVTEIISTNLHKKRTLHFYFLRHGKIYIVLQKFSEVRRKY